MICKEELELFSRNIVLWLNKVKNLYVEIHGNDCGEVVFGALANYEYDLSQSGHYCWLAALCQRAVNCRVKPLYLGRQLLTDECGIRVQLGTMKDHVDRFRTAMESLADDPQLRHAMGISASHRASSILDWNVKAKRIRQVYDWVVGVRKDKPDFYSELAP